MLNMKATAKIVQQEAERNLSDLVYEQTAKIEWLEWNTVLQKAEIEQLQEQIKTLQHNLACYNKYHEYSRSIYVK